MSIINLEEEPEAFTSQNIPLPRSFTRSLHSSDFSKESRLLEDFKDSSTTNSLSEGRKASAHELTSAKVSGPALKHERIKSVEPGKRNQRKISKDLNSPTSLNSSDISYKILNEMLNTQPADLTSIKAITNNTLSDMKRFGVGFNKTAESAADLLNNSTKIFVEEVEDMRNVEDKIGMLAHQLKAKLDRFENTKRSYAHENIILQETENKLKESYNILVKKLEDIHNKKTSHKGQLDLVNSREKFKRLTQEADNYHKEIVKLDEMIAKQENEREMREQTIESQYQAQLKELENAFQAIQDQKLAIHSKLSQIEDNYNEDLEKKAMMKEDLNSRLLQRAELVAQREELDQGIEAFREANSFELDYYNMEVQAKKDLESLTKAMSDLSIEKKSLSAQLKDITTQMANLNDQLFLVAKNHQILLNEKNDKTLEYNAEIEKIESLFNKKASSLELPSLDEIFVEIYPEPIDDMEREILINQAQLIEEGERKLSQNFLSRYENIMLTIQTLSKKKNDAEASNNLKKLASKLEQLELSYNIEKEALSKFKKQLEKSIEETDSSGMKHMDGNEYAHAKDIIDTLSEQKNIGKVAQLELKDLLKKYFHIIDISGAYAAQKFQEDLTFQEESKKVEDHVNKLKEQRIHVNKEIKRVEEDHTLSGKKKKQIESDLQEKRAVVESSLTGNAEAAFNAYLMEQAGTFDTITRTYGVKAAQNVKKEHFKEFLEITRNNLWQKIENYKKMQNELKQFDDIIQQNIDVVDQEVLPSLQKIAGFLGGYKEHSSNLKKNQIALLEKEDEINSELRIVLEQMDEKKKISKEDFDHTALQSLKHLRETKKLFERKFYSMKDEIAKLEDFIVNVDKLKTKEFLEEKKLQSEIKDIEEKLQKFEKIQKLKCKDLETEMEQLDKEILHERKVMEYLEQQKKSYEHKLSDHEYLNEDLSQHNNVESYVILNEKEAELSTSLHEDLLKTLCPKNPEKDYTSQSKLDRDEPKGSTWKNLEFSPIKNNYLSTEGHKRKEYFDENLLNYQSIASTQQFVSIDEDQSPWNSTLQVRTKPSFTRGNQQKITEGNYQNNSGHKRYDSVPTTISALEKQRAPNNNSNLGLNTFNLNIKKLMENSNESKRYSQDFSQNTGKSRVSQSPKKSRKEDSSFNIPLQSKKLNNRNNQVLTDYTNLKTNESLNMSHDSIKNIKGHSKENESVNRLPPGIPLRTIDEEQSQRDAPRKIFEQQLALNHMRKNQNFVGLGIPPTKEQQKNATLHKKLGSSGSKENNPLPMPLPTSISNNSRSQSASRQSRPDSIRMDNSRSKNLVQPSSQNNTRSRSLENKIGLELVANSRENLPPYNILGLGMNNYASVQADRPDNTRHQHHNSIEFNQTSMYDIHKDNYSQEEIRLIEIINPLVEGTLLFKKFGNTQSLKKAPFDPLTGEIHPPEACGYGMRHIKLSQNLEKLEIKNAFKPGIETSISLSALMRPMVPQVTMDILKVQKKIVELQTPVTYEGRHNHSDSGHTKSFFMQLGANNAVNLDKYANCSYYPFSILLEKGGRIDLVAPNYVVFKEWIAGLNYLIKNKKHLQKVRKVYEELLSCAADAHH